MRYFYTSTYKLYRQAVRTYIRSSPSRRFWFHFQMWGLLLLGLTTFVVTSLTQALPKHAGLLAPLIGGMVGGGVVGPILRPWSRRRCYKAWSAFSATPSAASRKTATCFYSL